MVEVTLTVTDDAGLTDSCTAMVTIENTTYIEYIPSPTTEIPTAFGALPSLATTNVPEAANYGVLYELDIPDGGGWRNTAIPYTVDASAFTGSSHTRVAYLLQLDSEWVWVSMDDFADSDLVGLGLPKLSTNPVVWETLVSNMNVYSNSTAITTGTGITTGNIEIWPQNFFGTSNDGIGGTGANDFDDLPAPLATGFSCLQIHNYGEAETIFAFNRFLPNNTNDVGIGTNTTGVGSPDWTASGTAPDYTVKKLYIMVGAFETTLTTDFTIQLDDGTATLAVADLPFEAVNPCENATLSLSQTTFDCTNIGTQTVQLIATADSGTINTLDLTITVEDPASFCQVAIAPKAYLQGAYLNPTTATLMNDDLRTSDLLPETSPYADALTVATVNVFADGGTLGTGTANDDIVDWVWVELRAASNNTTVVASQSALVQRDGDVVAIDGISEIMFNVEFDDYYVVLNHRNHLGVMTASTLALSDTATPINFSDSTTDISFGSNALVQMGDGTLALWAGNANNDSVVQYSGTTPDSPDILSSVLNEAGNFLNLPTYSFTGYNSNDLDMNGDTQYTGTTPDTPIILQNVLAHPGNFLNFSTYQITEQLPTDF